LKNLQERIDELIAPGRVRWTRKGGVITVASPMGRRTRLTVCRGDDLDAFMSLVLDVGARPEEISQQELAYRAWRRNAAQPAAAAVLSREVGDALLAE
jgi:hypothetical protein